MGATWPARKGTDVPPDPKERLLVVAVGDAGGGLARFATKTATAMGAYAPVGLYHADLGAHGLRNLVRQLLALRRASSGYGTVLLQASPYHWCQGPPVYGVLQVVLVHLALFRRAVLVMHDTRRRSEPGGSLYARLIATLHWALARKLVFLSETERALAGWAGSGRHVTVVPLYIEGRPAPRAEQPMSPTRLRLGVVGFIDLRKDPLFTLQVLHRLPGAHLAFLGDSLPGQNDLSDRLKTEIQRLQLDERVKVHGYLSDADLDRELNHIDIGLCLYRSSATSASLTTLLAAKRPVVASNLPIFEEYAKFVPSAVVTVEMDADRVARAVLQMANRAPDWHGELEQFAEARSLPNFGRHMCEAAGLRPSSPPVGRSTPSANVVAHQPQP